MGKNFAYLWIIKLERPKLGRSDAFLLRQGKTEPQKDAASHERFLALDSAYCGVIRCSQNAHYVPNGLTGFYPILFNNINSIGKFFELPILSKYSRSLYFWADLKPIKYGHSIKKGKVVLNPAFVCISSLLLAYFQL